ncbi:MAG TPA: DNA gyrase inhibitor YacG [Rhizomicrobium sp.]
MSRPSSGGQCPICGKPRDAAFRPFCSKRCADIDLARWLRGEYAIPGAPAEPDGEPPASEEDPEFH